MKSSFKNFKRKSFYTSIDGNEKYLDDKEVNDILKSLGIENFDKPFMSKISLYLELSFTSFAKSTNFETKSEYISKFLNDFRITDFFNFTDKDILFSKNEVIEIMKSINEDILNEKDTKFINNFHNNCNIIEKKIGREVTNIEVKFILLDSIGKLINLENFDKPNFIIDKDKSYFKYDYVLFDGYFYGNKDGYCISFLENYEKDIDFNKEDFYKEDFGIFRSFFSTYKIIHTFISGIFNEGGINNDLSCEEEIRDIGKQEQFIDHIISRNPVKGKVFLLDLSREGKGYVIISGYNYVKSILNFLTGNLKYGGKFFYQLNKGERLLFENYELPIANVESKYFKGEEITKEKINELNKIINKI